jgi:tRNA pseudouridine synthase 10
MVRSNQWPSMPNRVGKVPPTPIATKPVIESIEMTRESVYLGGRYLKYSRDVSQTPWAVGNTMLAELSVSGIVCEDIKEAFRADGKMACLNECQRGYESRLPIAERLWSSN